VDTAPLLEREFAQLAGLGWIGKNTMLLNKQLGSWFFLAALLTDVELDYDSPHDTDHCGTCRACLDACPTQAFVAPHVLDARRCISYLTKLKEPVPVGLRPGMGEWVFGCDVCQDVCPWNHHAPISNDEAWRPAEGRNPIDLRSLFWLDDAAFHAEFRHTPLWRPKRAGLLRNAAIVLGNHPHPDNVPALLRGLNDSEPVVRGAAAWALGRHQWDTSRSWLHEQLSHEKDEYVKGELVAALASRPCNNLDTQRAQSMDSFSQINVEFMVSHETGVKGNDSDSA
jgi:epoxyqueuosine reductase